jgi:hypothetical protein
VSILELTNSEITVKLERFAAEMESLNNIIAGLKSEAATKE